MSQYYRYHVELSDRGRQVQIKAEDPGGKTINEPGGKCELEKIPERIRQLNDKVRRGQARPTELDELGEALFEALFPPSVISHFRSLLTQVSQEDGTIRLELDLDEDDLPAVAALPWEFLRAPQTSHWAEDHLGTHPQVVLSRRRALWHSAPAITLAEPLRIQLVVSAPKDLGEVVYQEVESTLHALAQTHSEQIGPPLEILHQPTPTALDRVLEERKPHILHFIGHGKLRKARRVEFGELALVGKSGRADWRTDQEVSELFQGHQPQVVLLQACESGAEGSVGAFVGVASQLVQRNIPVVVAMQYPVSNVVAITFAEEFYRRLGQFEPVDEAVQKSRRLLKQEFKDTRDFASPVLFIRVKDGQLFVSPESMTTPKKIISPKPTTAEEASQSELLFPDEFTGDIPYPIAVTCAGFNAAQNDKARFEALDRLVNNFVKYLTAIALSQYWQDNPDKDQLRDWLRKLSRSRLTTSLTILNEISDHYSAVQEKSYIHPILFEPYVDSVDVTSPITAAYHAIRHLQDNGHAREEPITPKTFLTRLLAFREIKWESAPGEVDAVIRDELLPVLWSALTKLLDRFQTLFRYPLYYIERIDQDGKDWVYTVVAFPGAKGEPKVVKSPIREQEIEKPSYSVHSLYLCFPEGHPLLNLHPILIAHMYKLYFLEHAADREEIWYRHCGSAERYQPPGYYHMLSISWQKQIEEAGNENDPVTQFKQANDELEKDQSQKRFQEMPLPILVEYLTDEARQALEIALGEALRIGRFWLGIEFLMMGLSKQDGRPLGDLLHTLGMSRSVFRAGTRGMAGVVNKDSWRQADVAELGAQNFDRLKPANPETLAKSSKEDEDLQPVITPRMMEVLRDGAKLADEGQIGHGHLLMAALQHSQSPVIGLLFAQAGEEGWRPRKVLDWVAQQVNIQPLKQDQEPEPPMGLLYPVKPTGVEPPSRKIRGVLGTYGRDLTELAQHNELRPAVGDGAHKAMIQIGLILQQTQANNPILLGDSGVGKTAIVEGFAWRLAVGAAHDQPVISQLSNKQIVDLPPTALLAGTKYRGDLEKRLQQLVNEVREAAGETVVFIDEIHTIMGGKVEGGLGAIADALKPALARGEFPCIGATTVSEYRRYIESDPALARRFTPVWIEEPTIEEAIEIVTIVAQEYLGPRHGVTIPHETVKEAVNLAARYLHDERLPGKAVKLLDQAGPRVMMGGSLRGTGEGDKNQPVGGVVMEETVREIVSERTGIPLTRMSKDEGQRLLRLEDDLKKRVKGQDGPTRHVAQVVKRARAGFSDPRRPPGVFLFAGPTGVGKTELALALAEALFDEEDAIFRLDMSEYMEKHQVSRLIGSPPGYIGYEEEGQLTSRLRRRPYSVILLDEIEKAHEDVQHLFLQLFDAGRLTDARGNLADGRNAIFIMTTNLGAKVPMGFAKAQMSSFAAQMQVAIEEHFTPEFLNRIDRIVYFEPLDEDTLLTIFDRQLEETAARMREQGIELEVTEDFKRILCQRHTDTARGARPLKRAIEDEIVAPLTDQVLAGKIKPGTKVVVGEDVKMSQNDIPLEKPRQPSQTTADEALDEPMSAEPDVEIGPEETRNRAVLKPLFEKLADQLRTQEIEITLADSAQELLCSPFWIETRAGLGVEDAFTQFVKEALMQRVGRGEFEPSDRIEIYRNIDEIGFRKLQGE